MPSRGGFRCDSEQCPGSLERSYGSDLEALADRRAPVAKGIGPLAVPRGREALRRLRPERRAQQHLPGRTTAQAGQLSSRDQGRVPEVNCFPPFASRAEPALNWPQEIAIAQMISYQGKRA